MADSAPPVGLHIYLVLLATSILFHLLASPYTKVEESFNLQATHDVIFHGLEVSQYDHLEYPGVVPRTFAGAVTVGLAAKAVGRLIEAATPIILSKFLWLLLVRTVISAFVLASFFCLLRSIQRTFGLATAKWFSIILSTQFHLMFWCSRTLPNVFAFVLTNFALAYWIAFHGEPRVGPRNLQRMVSFLTISAAVFRGSFVTRTAIAGF